MTQIELHFNREYPDGEEVHSSRDASAFDAVRLVSSDFDWGATIIRCEPETLVIRAHVFGGGTDTTTYSGSAEALRPALEAAFYNAIQRERTGDVALLEMSLGEHAKKCRELFARLRAERVPGRALALCLPLKVEKPFDMLFIYIHSRRMDVSVSKLDAAFSTWQREGGDAVAVFDHVLGPLSASKLSGDVWLDPQIRNLIASST